MNSFTQHTLFKQVARLIITGTVFIIFFGNGLHIHSVIDHLFDHVDIHLILHTHPSDDRDTESGFANLDTEGHHQHLIASIDLSATLKQFVKKKDVPDSNLPEFAVSQQENSIQNDPSPTLLAQPPPGLSLTQYHSIFFSLRAPPIA